MKYCFDPIGIIHVKYSKEEVKKSVQGVDGVIEVFEEYSMGLYNLNGFSHIIIIAFLHEVTDKQRKVLKVKPRRLLRFGLKEGELPEIGVFASDSPHRPNPIAISIVRLKKIQERFLYVDGLDLYDKTPVLDIKPYTLSRKIENLCFPQWYISLVEKYRSRLGLEI